MGILIVLAERLAVVAHHHHQGRLIQPALLQIAKQPAQLRVGVVQGVEVAVELLVADAIVGLLAVVEIGVVRLDGPEHPKEWLGRVLADPIHQRLGGTLVVGAILEVPGVDVRLEFLLLAWERPIILECVEASVG